MSDTLIKKQKKTHTHQLVSVGMCSEANGATTRCGIVGKGILSDRGTLMI